MRLLPRLLLCATILVPLPVLAEDEATLVADSVEIRNETTLQADGHVEIFYKGQRLTASRVVYDQAANRLTIEGPIVIEDGHDRILLADQGALDADFSNGVLTSARMVLGKQLQLSAAELRRVGDRYTSLGRTVASSCQICAGSPTPVWEIRARRVVHDEQERMIHFDGATFRMVGVPLAYIPHLRMPDPSVTRATGFLRPSLRTTSGLGTGINLPYFLALGDDRDLTLTPYVSTKGGQTLGLAYRESFSFGDLEIKGAVSRDDILPGEERGYLDAHGSFALPRNFRLDVQVQEVSDRSYYDNYDLGDRDRLASGFEVTRTTRDEHVSGRLLKFHSLRTDEDNDTLPSLVGDITYERRLDFGRLGGEGGLTLQTHSSRRSSSLGVDTTDDSDTIADGRDTSRVSATLDWQRTWVLPAGVLGTISAEAGMDAYDIRQDATWQGSETRLRGTAAAELRWPLVRAQANGTSDVVQPIFQLAWADASNARIPDEDSVLVEFDESSLFALDRFPGYDSTEEGRRATLGVNWTRTAASGWTLGATVGRVLWQDDNDGFSTASGLDGDRSDWLTAVKLTLPDGLTLIQRTIIDADFGVTKAEWRIDYNHDRLGLSSRFLRFRASEEEGRSDPVSEMRLSGNYKFADQWAASMTGLYDFEEDRTTWAKAGLVYRSECLAVNLSLSRRFSSSTSVTASTDFGVLVDLIGFGSGAAPGPARACRS